MNELSKNCPMCGKVKSPSDFMKDSRRKDGRGSYCKDCYKIRQQKYREENKEKLVEYHKSYREENKDKLDARRKEYYEKNREKIIEKEKNRRNQLISLIDSLRTRCVLCGDERRYVLQFHHKDPLRKRFYPSQAGHSKKRMLDEVSKCIVLCSNCHSEFHHYEKKTEEISLELLKKYKELDLKFISN